MAALLALWLISPAPAAPSDAGSLFHSAEVAERGLGDLRKAASLYREAAEAYGPDTESRARAEVRAGSCLRRSGDPERASALLERWATDEGISAAVREFASAELEAMKAGPGSAPEHPCRERCRRRRTCASRRPVPAASAARRRSRDTRG